jgi:cytochrome b561
MMTLDYYDAWYQNAPNLHLGLGVLSAILLIIRFVWRLSNPQPKGIGKAWEQKAAIWAHRFFYLLIASIIISGYLITTAEGQAVYVFGWFEIPATLYGYANQESLAGEFHDWLSITLVALLVLHILATLKHHFIDRDATLRRILGDQKD